MTVATTPELVDSEAIVKALRLIAEPGQVVELRALEATTARDKWPSTISGYFNDPQKLAQAAATITSAKGIYITPNPADPSLLSRAANRIRKVKSGETTSDNDITRRRWLLIDVDAKRASGISASEKEHWDAQVLAEEIELFLHDLGWPNPIRSDSGNGGHLLYPINLPADDGGLVQRVLEALAKRFNTDAMKVDTSVYNPARIWKLYGTRACKGDSTEDRPHRMAKITTPPDRLEVVPLHLLEELAGPAPEPQQHHDRNGHHQNGTLQPFDLQSFISRNGLDVRGPNPWSGDQGTGKTWTFTTSPMCEHHDDGPHIIQHGSGAITAGCQHDSCGWTWADLRQKFEPKANGKPAGNYHGAEARGDDEQPRRRPVQKFTLEELVAQYPRLKPPVLNGLIRAGETANIVTSSKVGKSWLAYNLAISIMTGTDWLGTFSTSQGGILLIDNELHKETVGYRIPKVGEEMGYFFADYSSLMEVWPLRGNLRSLYDLQPDFDEIPHGKFKAIILDAKYRFGNGESENDNAAETALYNQLDRLAEQTGAAFVLIHHSSKGSQTDKRVTDVGSGAGAQSRAADCHIIMREHEEPDTVVFDAAVRSFPPVAPMALRWCFPLWIPDTDVDPSQLKGKKSKQEQEKAERDKSAVTEIMKVLLDGPATARQLRAKTSISRDRLTGILDRLAAEGQLTTTETKIRGNKCLEYSLANMEV